MKTKYGECWLIQEKKTKEGKQQLQLFQKGDYFQLEKRVLKQDSTWGVL